MIYKKSTIKYYTTILSIIFICLSSTIFANEKFSTVAKMKTALAEAKELMLAQEGDKAIAITKPLMKHLKKNGQYDSSFGFRVRLIHGRALYISSEEVSSVEYLWKLRDESKAYKQWYVYADVCVEIAKVKEIAGQSEEALQHLHIAKGVIEKHSLDSLYGQFSIQSSSWHRIFGNIDSSYYYANKAIQTGQRLGIPNEEATGYWLSAFLLHGNNELELPDSIDRYNLGIEYFQKASEIYKSIEDFSTYAGVQSNLAGIRLQQKSYQEALNHADSAVKYAIRIQERSPHTIVGAYGLKAHILKQMNRLDSAFVYFQKRHEAEVFNLKSAREQQLLEVDKKYNIAQKNKELEAERVKTNFLIGFVGFAIFFASILIFYYLKLRKANKVVEQQAEELKNLDKVKSLFFANISHELRTPLTLITGPVQEILNQEKLEEQKTRFNLSLINKNSQRLQQMVNEILDLSKLEASKMELNPKPINWHQFIRRILANFESLAAIKSIDYQLNYDDSYKNSEDFSVTLDPNKIETVFNNLLSNAFKFTPDEGQIIINAGITEKYLWFSIYDTGRGISSEDLPHIFKRYYQTKNKNQAAEGGTGIGLALTKELVLLHNGTIEVESQLGKGTTFKVQLPLEIVTAKVVLPTENNQITTIIKETTTTEIKETSIANIKQKNTILLVEDNPDLSVFIKSILEEYYNVETATNGQEALLKLGIGNEELVIDSESTIPNSSFLTPDLIISDVMMPIMDGFQLLKILKSTPIYKHIPVVMLTARAALKDKLKGLRIGVDDYLTKPFIKEELLARIENLLQRAKERKEAIKLYAKQDAETTPKNNEIQDTETQQWLDDLEKVVLQNIEFSEFTVDTLAAELYMSNRQLYRKIKKLIGVTPLQYIKTYKLNYARELLENKKVSSVKVAAYSIGYPNLVYFRREFKKAFGRPPSDFLS